MWRFIARKEIKEAFRNRQVLALALLLWGLVAFSLGVSWEYYQKTRQEYSLATQKVRQQWENQGLKNPHSAAHFGTFAFKPVPALAMIEPGLNAYLGVSVFLEAHRQNLAQYKQIADQNDLARFAELTPAFVLVYLVPLLIIFSAFRAFTAERERETLKLMMAQGVSSWQIALGKITGLGFCLALVLLPIFLLGLGLLFVSGAPGADFILYLLLWGALLLYYVVFINLSVAVSARAKNSATALVSLLGIWVLSALLVPKLLVDFSKQLHPSPTAIEYQSQLKKALSEGIDGHNPFSEKVEIFQDSVLKAHGVDSIQALPFNFDGLLMQAGEEHETIVYEKAMQARHERYQRQLAVHQASALLSPTLLVRLLAMQLARTDWQSHYDFTRQAEKYRIALVRQLNYDIKDHAPYGDWEYVPKDPDFFRKNVRFQYTPASLSQTLAGASLGLGLLLIWVLLSGLGLAWGLKGVKAV